MNANEFLARELMGWVKTETGYYKKKDGYPPDALRCRIKDWNPLEDINQAFEVVEKMAEIDLTMELATNNIRRVCLTSVQFYNVISAQWFDMITDKNPATAITLAAACALGWKEGENG